MKKVKPDQYYADRILEMARFGEKIIMHNTLSFAHHKQLLEQFRTKYDASMCEINKKIVFIRDKVSLCDPIQLLTFSSDMGLISYANLRSEFDIDSHKIPIMRATEYLQSILVSTPHQPLESKDLVTDNSVLFFEILKNIEDLYTLIQDFYLCWVAKLDELIPDADKGLKEFVLEAQLLYLVRGQRYQIFEIEYFEKLLSKHNEIFLELFNLRNSDITEAIQKLQYSLTQGKFAATNQLQSILEEDEDNQSASEEEFFSKHHTELKDMFECIFGTKLRDVVKITGWPEVFLNELSWALNSAAGFFDESQFSGWPIVDLPVSKRPFIKVDSITYCFDYYSFIDNFYRVLQKTVTRLCPDYNWADYQQQASEKMVKDIFESLLPNSKIFSSNYYPINGSLKQSAENDMIVLYDDTLIIVEVKAGSFVYTPPINDYKAHIESYKTLIEKADWQCQRTKDYLTSNSQPVLYDVNHEVKAHIDMTKVSSIFIMSITVDNINIVAAKAEKMSFLQLKCNAISIGVDDLMIYRDYFQSPLMFLHFIQQRSLATQEPKLSLNDELDHLGMYIKHNQYATQADIIPKNAIGIFMGYREELDNYFTSLYHPQLRRTKPIQSIPSLFLKIIDYLEVNNVEGRSYVANYFLNFASDAREGFSEQVKRVLNRQRQIKHEVVIHASGTGDSLRYTCFVNQQGIVEPSYLKKRERTLSCILWNKDPERYLIDLYFDDNDEFVKIQFERFTVQDIRSEEELEIKKLGEEIAERRLREYQQSHTGKIGRNELCPCGSGRKYKRCCGK